MLKLRDIMTADVVGVSPETTLREAAELLATRHIGGVPVIAGTHVVGVLSAGDLLGFAASNPTVPRERDARDDWGELEDETVEDEVEAEDLPAGTFFTELWADAGADVTERTTDVDSPEWDMLSEHTVAEAMTRRLWALPPEASVSEAAGLMCDTGIHRVLVVRKGELLGIVTTMDIASAVATHKLHVPSRWLPTQREPDTPPLA